MNNKLLLTKIYSEEGFKSEMYDCPAGKKTIGGGINLESELMPRQVSDLWMTIILEKRINSLNPYPWFYLLDDIRKIAIIDMSYQLGIAGLLAFENMIDALGRRDWEEASKEALDSKWARQTPNRAKRNAHILLTGEL